MNRSARPRVRTPLLHRPKLERLEPRLPPGDALLGVLITSSFASLPVSDAELTLTAAGVTTFENVDPKDSQDVPPSALSGKSVRTAVTDQEAIGSNRKFTLDAALPLSAPERSHGIGQLVVARMGQVVAGQSAMIGAPGVQGLAVSHPALARPPALAGHVVAVGDPATPAPADEAPKSKALDNYGNLPLTFEANHGQTDSRVDFITRTGGATVFLTPTAAVFNILQDSPCPSHDRSRDPQAVTVGHDSNRDDCPPANGASLHMQIVGANPDATPVGQQRQPGIVNYFIGDDPSQWHANIPTFGRVEYQDVYPGIDLAYYGNNGQLEYDFIVSPGADPNAITLNFAGADSVEVNPQGDLVMHTAAGDVVQRKPFTYQDVGQTRQEATSQYKLDGTQARFEVGTYDPTRPLVIDPVLLKYSSYLGASDYDTGEGIAMDSNGNAYMTGTTQSADYPTTPGVFDTAYNGQWDTFVTKLNAAGSALVYSTYLGGSNANDFGYGIAVDGAGNAYATGTTLSSNFPTTSGASDNTHNGGWDAFVSKLSEDGSVLGYSTYLGGGSDDFGYGVGVDDIGNAYIAGSTNSSNFPTTLGAFDSTYNGGPYDPFVTKLNRAGSTLSYSTFVGGTVNDYGDAITVDANGNAYLTGWTMSSNFPTTVGAYDTGHNGVVWDAFVTKLNVTGSALAYSTFLGGSGDDYGHGIAVDSGGNAFVTGETTSNNFPTTAGAFDTTYTGNSDVFVTKLNAAGSGLAYSSFLGGSSGDIGYGIGIDGAGGAYVTGATGSSNFPTTGDAFDTTYNGGTTDAFVAKLEADGSKLAYSTFMGGSNVDAAAGIAVDARGEACVTGLTWSTSFPTTTAALDTSLNGPDDAFVTKFKTRAMQAELTSDPAPPPTIVP